MQNLVPLFFRPSHAMTMATMMMMTTMMMKTSRSHATATFVLITVLIGTNTAMRVCVNCVLTGGMYECMSGCVK